MNQRALFEIWSPRHVAWSRWTKPVAFAAMDDLVVEQGTALGVTPPEAGVDLASGLVPAEGAMAVVVDLPGAEAVAVGLALARGGYRPVPLFNACGSHSPPPLVPVEPILDALIRSGPALRSIGLPDDAPPAFLVDADRLLGDELALPAPRGWFDNRWVVFASDLPSARFLREAGIGRVALIHRGAIGTDLAEVFHTWSREGLAIVGAPLGHPGPPEPLGLPARSGRLFAHARRLLWAWLKLQPNAFGGFGRASLPEGGSSFG